MSADLLRRAAAKLREHAKAATPGPWTAARGTDHNWVVDGDSRPGDHAWVALMMFGECEADAAFIALMHPPVALALAEWLDDAALSVDARIVAEQHVGIADGTTKTSAEDAALAVACAVLREDGESR